jgi:virulence-associated protein VagC
MIYTVESSLADELKKPADDYRRKELFEFRAFNATHVEITRAGATLVFEKVKGQGKDATDTWRQVKPTARDVDTTKFDTFLSRVSNLRAASFVDPKTPTGLQSPALAVFVRFDEGKKEERVAFARVGTDVFASRPGEPGAAKVETTEYDDLIKALDEVK